GEPRFFETYLAADVAVCERRDPRGLYAKARSGEILDFTGVNAPYEVPDDPSIVLATARDTAQRCVDVLYDAARKLIAARFRRRCTWRILLWDRATLHADRLPAICFLSPSPIVQVPCDAQLSSCISRRRLVQQSPKPEGDITGAISFRTGTISSVTRQA